MQKIPPPKLTRTMSHFTSCNFQLWTVGICCQQTMWSMLSLGQEKEIDFLKQTNHSISCLPTCDFGYIYPCQPSDLQSTWAHHSSNSYWCQCQLDSLAWLTSTAAIKIIPSSISSSSKANVFSRPLSSKATISRSSLHSFPGAASTHSIFQAFSSIKAISKSEVPLVWAWMGGCPHLHHLPSLRGATSLSFQEAHFTDDNFDFQGASYLRLLPLRATAEGLRRLCIAHAAVPDHLRLQGQAHLPGHQLQLPGQPQGTGGLLRWLHKEEDSTAD